MAGPLQPELLCPRCGIEVQPIKAAIHWYCPHCVWQFTDDEVRRSQQRPRKDAPDPPPDDKTDEP